MDPNFDLAWLAKKPEDLFIFLQDNLYAVAYSQQPTKDITYSFYTSTVTPPDEVYQYTPVGEPPKSTPFTPQEIEQTKAILNYLSFVFDLNFEEVPAGQGMVRLAHANMSGVDAYSDYPNDEKGWQKLFIRDSLIGSEPYWFIRDIIHEFGHILGLKHPGNYAEDELAPFLSEQNDTRFLTAMSYNDSNKDLSYAPLDIAALYAMYNISQKSEGIYYKFVNPSNNEITENATGLMQSFIHNEYTVPLASDSVFWAVPTTGFDVIDLSNYATQAGIFVDGSHGIISVKEPFSSNPVDVWNWNSQEWVSGISVENLGNINVFPSAQIAELVLNNSPSNIVLGDAFRFIKSGSSNDIFSGIADSITFDASGGTDTWQIGGASGDYKVIKLTSGYQIFDTVNGLSETGISVEILGFNDGKYASDVSINQDNSLVYRLYGAVFGRAPDDMGFRYWIEQHDNHFQGIDSISSKFISSTEFITNHGVNLTNAQLVDLFYKNALGRAGDIEGVSYWINELDTGHLTKEQVLWGFATSAENVAKTAVNIDNGYWLV